MIEGLVSVILPTTGRAHRVMDCVKLLLETTLDWHIEVDASVDVDMQSRDLLREFLDGYRGPNLRRWQVPFCDRYQGQAAAWNAGVPS